MDSQQQFIDWVSAQICAIESSVVQDLFAGTPRPSGIQEVAENAAGFAEDTTQKLDDPSFSIACKAGCNWCCYQPVHVTSPEVFRIARFIRSMPDSDREKLISRLRDLDKRTRKKYAKKFTKRRAACAFLNDGLCSIYSVRPLRCAEFTSADVKDCKRAYRKGFRTTSVTHEKSRAVAYKAVQRGLLLGLAKALPKTDTSLFELRAAVLAALDHRDSETAWLEGKPVFAKART